MGGATSPLSDWLVSEPAEVIRLEDVRCDERLGGLLKSYSRAAA
jgi:hypothetical protein